VEIALLPVDLGRWDQAEGGDLFVVPVWSDLRPLRGAAGLLDWRLNGRLSACLRKERFRGAFLEKLLWPTRRIPWRTVLAVGLGPAATFDDACFRAALAVSFQVQRGLGYESMAVALPGREVGRIEPDRAVTLMREVASEQPRLSRLTVLDTPAALKVMSERLGLSAPKAAAGARP
jgi:hypothetical protein